MEDIHEKDIDEVYAEFEEIIQKKKHLRETQSNDRIN